MEVDHELVEVGEFDALAIELKLSPCAELAADVAEGRAPSPDIPEVSGKYPAKEHAKKVARELGSEHGLVYLPGLESQLYEDSDMAPEFRQRRYFYYLSGANFADCAVTYHIERDWLILWIPYTDPRKELWYGATPGIAECKERLHVDEVRYARELKPYLTRFTSGRPDSTLFVLHPDQTPAFVAQPGQTPASNRHGHARIDSTRLQPAMDAARVVKTEHEVRLVRRANAVSSAAHRAVLRQLRRFANEREIDAVFRAACIARGAPRQAYPVIAGSGANAATLHYEDNNQPLAGRQLVVLDAGCEYDCYASDVTRTLPLDTTPSPEARAVYAIVERMQEECIAAVAPGVPFRSLHLHACAVAAEGLLRLGVLRGGTEREILTRGTVAAFFPHGLGHHVGLEVHDVEGRERLLLGDVAAAPAMVSSVGGSRGRRRGKRQSVSPEMVAALCREAETAAAAGVALQGSRQRLEKNMIVTIEPGIYFCRSYIEAYFLANPAHAKYIDADVLERYYPVGGVRIEDDILVTDEGYENLTTAPKGEEALKIINGS